MAERIKIHWRRRRGAGKERVVTPGPAEQSLTVFGRRNSVSRRTPFGGRGGYGRRIRVQKLFYYRCTRTYHRSGAPAESSVDYVARRFMCPPFNGRASVTAGFPDEFAAAKRNKYCSPPPPPAVRADSAADACVLVRFYGRKTD